MNNKNKKGFRRPHVTGNLKIGKFGWEHLLPVICYTRTPKLPRARVFWGVMKTVGTFVAIRVGRHDDQIITIQQVFHIELYL